MLGFGGINLQHKPFNNEYSIQELKQTNMAVGAYVVDDLSTMESLKEMKVDFFTTNKPWVIMDLLKNKNSMRIK